MSNKERTNRSAEAVAEIRKRIEEDYKEDSDLFDQDDFKRVLNDDWYVKRFLLIKKRKVDDGYKALKDTLVWRREMNLHKIKDYDFPAEIYSSSLLFPYEPDKEGHPVLYLRVSKYTKMPEMESTLRKYVIHLLDKMDQLTNGNGIGMVFDLTNASTSSIDWTFLKYFTDTGTNYFPYSIKYVLIYNLPWYLNAIQKVALSLVPKENMGIVKFGKGPQIFDYVDESNLPDFLGGKCLRDYRYCPKSAPKLEKFLEEVESLNNEQVVKISSIFAKISEIDKQSEAKNYTSPIDFFDEKTNDFIESTHIAPTMNQTYLIVEPSILLFSDNQGSDHLSSQLILRNVCDNVVAFKIKSNNALKYRVTPSFGMISPKATFKVNLIRLVGLEGFGHNKKTDKILVESQLVTKTPLIGSEFYNLWNSPNQLINSHKLVCKINKKESTHKKKVNKVHFKSIEDDQIKHRVAMLQKKYANYETQQSKTSVLFSITLTFFLIIISYFLATHSDIKTVRYLRNNATFISSDQ